MPAEDPEVAALRDRLSGERDLDVGVVFQILGVEGLRQRRHDVAVVLLGVSAEHERDLAGVDVGENFGEGLVVGDSELGDAVVCRQVGQLLGLAGVVLVVDRGLGQLLELRSHEAAVALDDQAAAGADGDGPAPAGGPDDGAEGLDLLWRVCVGVFRVGPQIPERDDGVVGAENGDAAGVGFGLCAGGVVGRGGALRFRFILCHWCLLSKSRGHHSGRRGRSCLLRVLSGR